MKIKRLQLYLLSATLILAAVCCQSQESKPLQITSTKKVGQIEVGGPFVGIEIHNSFPMINRISFYYPVANSIDISQNYWKRENFRIMSLGIKEGDSSKYLLENEVYKVTQTPYSVEFYKDKTKTGITIKYEFCKNKPAMVSTIRIKNNSEQTKIYEVYSRYEAVFRTSHTYSLIDSANSTYDRNRDVLKFDYPSIEVGNAQLFFANAGEKPKHYTSSSLSGQYKNLDEYWTNSNGNFNDIEISEPDLGKPAAAFIYSKELNSGESLDIIHIIGSVKKEESNDVISYLKNNYSLEVKDYEDFVLSNSAKNKIIRTNNSEIDFTSDWAMAVLTTNAHYIDSEIVPMPAQAEYNFYFTHDALLTDLAAVNFDLDRVKRDLQFIIKHADSNNIIPHAYYWKDTSFKTEYAGTENWNHFWFAMLCARYLRHSNDLEFARTLYPYAKKSIDTALKNKGDDNLMYSFRPDWWDIGNNFGPRAYMTILAIKALREFSYFAASLNINESEISNYSSIAENLHQNLIEKLWNQDLQYLTSYFADGTEDKHIYMGSLLASHFNLLSEERNNELMNTAQKYLLDSNLGVYTLFPMDLHKLGDYMGFAGDEAGQPFYYANGGIWPHGNAWYVLGLISNNKNEDAYEFIKKIMTMAGVMNSPNGQPAMYEYRISDKSNPDVYGKIDKPQFLWAGGWYLYSLYNLFGVKENDWNISFAPYLPSELDSIKLSLTLNGDLVPVEISGKGKSISSILFNDVSVPSAIVPIDIKEIKNIKIKIGSSLTPYLNKANAKLYSPRYNNEAKTLEFTLESIANHYKIFELNSPNEIEKIFIDEKEFIDEFNQIKSNELNKIEVRHRSKKARNHYSIIFK